MPRPDLLENDDLTVELLNNPFWIKTDNKIVRELVASNFAMAVGIVNAIAVLSESMNHYPDILIYGWNKIRIISTTADSGGLTKLDFDLARKIDELNF